jgi:hypothetical protein
MNSELLAYVTEKTNELLAAPMCCPEGKAAAEAFLQAVSDEKADEAITSYIVELEEDITGIDDLIAFAGSEQAKAVFGEEGASSFLAHARDLKAGGALYCDCPACCAVKAILDRRSELLKA